MTQQVGAEQVLAEHLAVSGVSGLGALRLVSEIETFDPRIFSSPSAMVEALQGLNIALSQRLGVRIFAMGAQKIQFSLATLELLAQSPALQNELASPKLGLSGAGDPAKRLGLAAQLRELFQDQAEIVTGALDEDGIELLQIVSADEAMLFQLTQQPSGTSGERGLVPAQSQALPRLLGNQAQYLPKGSTFDRNKLEMAAQRLLDSENVATLVEDFRYLFRASMTLRQNPSSLLESALTREKPELSREVASAIKDHLDNALGSLLLDLFGEDPDLQLNAIARLSKLEVLPEARILTAISRNLWALEENREDLLLSAASWGPALRQDPAALQHLLDLFLGSLDEMLPAQKARLHDMLLSWHKPSAKGSCWDELWLELGRRGERVTRDFRGVSLQLFLIRLFHGSSNRQDDLSSDPLHSHSENWMREILRDWGERAGILERATLVLEMMSDDFLCELLPFEVSGSWSETVQTRLYFAGLDRVCPPQNTTRTAESIEQLQQCLSEFCFDRLLHRQKTVTLSIARGQNTNLVISNDQPCWLLQDHFGHRLVEADLPQRISIGDFLADLIRVVEAPDDDRLFLVLSRLEWSQVVSAHQRLMESIKRGGSAAAIAFWFFSKLLYSRFVSYSEQSIVLCQVHFKQTAEELARDCLELPLFEQHARPQTWLALGFLGSWPSLSVQLRREIFQLLLIAADPKKGKVLGEDEWKAIAQSIQQIHQTAQTDGEELALEIERSLMSRLEVEPGLPQRSQTPPNLTQALDLLNCISSQGHLCQPLPLLTLLSRRLAAPPQSSLQKALMDALREDDGGDMAVQIRRSWDQDDLEKAVEICAVLARQPLASRSPEGTPSAEAIRISELAATRLLAVTEDWLQRLTSSRESYSSRAHCVWNQWVDLIERGLTSRAQQSCQLLVQNLLGLHEKKPFQLGLRDRGEVLKFLFSWSRWCLSQTDCAGQIGAVRAVVDVIGQLARPQEDDQHPPVAFHFLEKYSTDPKLSTWPRQVQAVVHSWKGLLIRPSN